MNPLSATSADCSRFLHKSTVKFTSLLALFHLRRNFKVIQRLWIFNDETYTPFVGFNKPSLIKFEVDLTDHRSWRIEILTFMVWQRTVLDSAMQWHFDVSARQWSDSACLQAVRGTALWHSLRWWRQNWSAGSDTRTVFETEFQIIHVKAFSQRIRAPANKLCTDTSQLRRIIPFKKSIERLESINREPLIN